jgi:hypothetical protein
MKRMAICFAVIGALVFAGVAAKAADPAKVAGTWEMTSQGRQGPVTSTITIEQDGNKIKGTIKREGGRGDMPGLPFTGTVDGNKITFTTEFTTPNGDKRTTEYSGTVEGDTIKGTMKTGQGEREWSAKRTK